MHTPAVFAAASPVAPSLGAAGTVFATPPRGTDGAGDPPDPAGEAASDAAASGRVRAAAAPDLARHADRSAAAQARGRGGGRASSFDDDGPVPVR